jgi:hypothetical protein
MTTSTVSEIALVGGRWQDYLATDKPPRVTYALYYILNFHYNESVGFLGYLDFNEELNVGLHISGATLATARRVPKLFDWPAAYNMRVVSVKKDGIRVFDSALLIPATNGYYQHPEELAEEQPATGPTQ